MKNSETLTVMKANNAVINLNLKDISHADSLLRAGEDSNCINWILGHIIQNRDGIRELLGMPGVCDDAFSSVYERGSIPVVAEKAIQIDELISMYNAGQKDIEDKIAETDFSDRPDDLKTLTFLAFHEAYHVGQTGILRRVAGKSGAVK